MFGVEFAFFFIVVGLGNCIYDMTIMFVTGG